MGNGDDRDGVFGDSSSTGGHAERSSTETTRDVDIDWDDPVARKAMEQRMARIAAENARYEAEQAAERDPWDQPASGPTGPIGELDEQALRDAGEQAIDVIRHGLEAVPGATEVIDAVTRRPLVSQAGPEPVDDVLGIASITPVVAATTAPVVEDPTPDLAELELQAPPTDPFIADDLPSDPVELDDGAGGDDVDVAEIDDAPGDEDDWSEPVVDLA